MTITAPGDGELLDPQWAQEVTDAVNGVVDDQAAEEAGWSTTWSPTLTNLTKGAGGTLIAHYRQVGKTVDWYFRFVYGTGSAVGTDPTFTLPVTPASHYPVAEAFGNFPGEARLVDASTTTRQGNLHHPTSATVSITFWNATPTIAQVTATAPWTWTTGDSITAWGRYEAA